MGQIKVTKCDIEGLYIIEPAVHGDARGYFMETYNYNDYAAAGIDMEFVQDNQSMSKKGVLRGLHFQKQFPHFEHVVYVGPLAGTQLNGIVVAKLAARVQKILCQSFGRHRFHSIRKR